MKEVMAVIRMNMISKTKKALAEAGITSMTAREALGRGKGLIDLQTLDGAEKGHQEAIAQLGQSQRLFPKRILTVIVPDKLLRDTVKTVIETNRTGKSGDGKIFVLPVEEAYRIRTSEKGDIVLDEG